MDIVVQPSIGWQGLNTALARLDSGLFFPVDPGTLISEKEYQSFFLHQYHSILLIVRGIHRPERQDRRYDRDQLLRHKRSQVWHYEGLGHQPYCSPSGWYYY